MSQVMPASNNASNKRKRSSSSDAVDSQTLHDTVAAVNDALVAAGRTDLVPRFAALVRLLPLHLHQQTLVEQPQQLPQPCPVTAAVTASPPSSRYTEAARLQAGRAVKATDWWTLYPHELKAKILRHAGPLTQLLCGHLDAAKMDDDAKRALWVDAFKMDWQGDLALLPDADLLPKDFAHVSSRSMYHRLWARFPYHNLPRLFSKSYIEIRHGMCTIPIRHMWLDSLPLMPHDDFAMVAVKGDHAAFLEFMLDNNLIPLEAVETIGFTGSTSRIDDAAWQGSLNVIKMLSARDASATSKAIDNGAEFGHLDTVKWLHANRTEGCTTWAMDWAAGGGHLDVLQWLHEHRTEGCTTRAINYAAKKGHLEVVQWLLANRTEGFTYKAIAYAADDDIARLLARSLTAEQRAAMVRDAEDNDDLDFALRLDDLMNEPIE